MNNDEAKKRHDIYKQVEETLQTDGWKLIEEDIKNNLRTEYAGLMDVSEKELKEKQLKISLLKNMMIRVYQLAGWEWTWSGYTDIREEIEIAITREEKKHQDYLKSIEGGEL